MSYEGRDIIVGLKDQSNPTQDQTLDAVNIKENVYR